MEASQQGGTLNFYSPSVPQTVYSNTETEWTFIKNKLEAECNDDTPFLMLPVKLETRFMKVHRSNYVNPNDVKKLVTFVKAGFANVADKGDMYVNFAYQTKKQVFQSLDELHKETLRQHARIASERDFSIDEQFILNESLDDITTNVGRLKNSIDNNQLMDTADLAIVAQTVQQMNSNIQGIKNDIGSKTLDPNTKAHSLVKADVYALELKNELWVRIYPDDIFLHTHEEPLTLKEQEDAEAYWTIWWNSNGDFQTRIDAWAELCETYGPQRAAWLIRQTTPENFPAIPDIITFAPVKELYSIGGMYQNMMTSAASLNTKAIADEMVSFTSLMKDINLGMQTARFAAQDVDDLKEVAANVKATLGKYAVVAHDWENTNVQYSDKDVINSNPGDLTDQLFREITLFKAANNDYIGTGAVVSKIIAAVTNLERLNDQDLKSLRIREADLDPTANKIALLKREVFSMIGVAENSKKIRKVGIDWKARLGGGEPTIISTLTRVDKALNKLKGHVDVRRKELKTLAFQADKTRMKTEHSKLAFEFTKVEALIQQYVYYGDDWNVFNYVSGDPIFPSQDIKDESWTEAPRTFVMPDQFVAIGLQVNQQQNGSETYAFQQLEVGNKVPPVLHLGPNPLPNAEDELETFYHDASGDLVVEEKMKWMVDFNEAVEQGMGIIMDLENDYQPGQANNVFDRLLVMGLKIEKERFHKPDANKDYSGVALEEYSKELLEQLLENHHYTGDGMNLMNIGTPTNNTSTTNSGFKFDERTFQESFDVETPVLGLFSKTTDSYEMTDGQRLADALGVDYNIFQHIQHADRKEVTEALHMNAAMWDGTMGSYLNEMFSGIFTRNTIDHLEGYFKKYVTARGMIPSIRVGEQPYGILPASSMARWKFDFHGELKNVSVSNDNILESPTYSYGTYADIASDVGTGNISEKWFYTRMKKFFDLLSNEWNAMANNKLLYVGKTPGVGETAQDNFMKILGLHATAAEYNIRYSFNEKAYDNDVTIPTTGTQASLLDEIGLTDAFSSFLLGGLYNSNLTNPYNSSFVSTLGFTNSPVKLITPANGGFLSEKQLLSNENGVNFMKWFTENSLSTIHDFNKLKVTNLLPSNSLMFQLMRQSYLNTYMDAVSTMLIKHGLLEEDFHHQIANPYMFVDESFTAATVGKWRYLFDKVFELDLQDLQTILGSSLYNNITLGKLIENEPFIVSSITGGYESRLKVKQLDKHFKKLSELPTARLDRLFQENLDLNSYRMDAWSTGLVNKRLFDQRKLAGKYKNRKEGIYLGAFGWLENVKPGGTRTAIPQNQLPETLQNNQAVYEDADNQGFILAPSIAHGLTSAILRSGYLVNKAEIDTDNPEERAEIEKNIAVNLSSERLRIATDLLEGVRNGQPLGALLGYRFERALHEKYNLDGLNIYVSAFRASFGLEPNATETDSDSSQTAEVYAQYVVDGVKVLAAFRKILKDLTGNDVKDSFYEDLSNSGLYNDFGDILFNNYQITLPVIETPASFAILREIDYMANAIDALADLALAEGVFQIAKGNYTKSGVMLEAMADGASVPESEIGDSPATGLTLTQKFAIKLEKADVSTESPWGNATELTPMAKAEPSLNKWMKAHFPDAANIQCKVKHLNEEGENEETIVSLADLKMEAIDFVFAMMAEVEEGSSVMLRYISNYVRDHGTYYTDDTIVGLPKHIALDIQFSKATGETDTFSFLEMMPIVQHLHQVVANGRAMHAKDMHTSDAAAHGYGYDIAELESRYISSKNDLNTLISGLETPGISLDDKKEYLLASAAYGIAETIPQIGADYSPEITAALDDTILAVKERLAQRLASSEALYNQIADAFTSGTAMSVLEQKDIYVACSKAIFGKHFVLLPHFKATATPVPPAEDMPVATQTTIAQFAAMQDGGSFYGQDFYREVSEPAMDAWFFGLSRVRQDMGAYETLSAFKTIDTDKFTPVQFPYKAGDRWLGIEFPEVEGAEADYYTYPDEDKLSLVFTDDTVFADIANNETMVCILLDEWTELIPEKSEIAGITFNYDQPNAKAPQAMVLAVAPNQTGQWEFDDLVFTLLESLKMAKIRLVEPDHLKDNPNVGPFLSSIIGMSQQHHFVVQNDEDRRVLVDYAANMNITN